MSKFWKISIVVVLLGGVGYMLFSIITTWQHKKTARQKRKQLPSFSFMTLDSVSYTKERLPEDQPLVVVYFNPKCGSCEYQWKQIKTHIDELDDFFFLLVSGRSSTVLKNFEKKQSLEQYNNIQLVKDHKDMFYDLFGTREYPSLFIYNSQGKLIKSFDGAVKAKVIRNTLKEREE